MNDTHLLFGASAKVCVAVSDYQQGYGKTARQVSLKLGGRSLEPTNKEPVQFLDTKTQGRCTNSRTARTTRQPTAEIKFFFFLPPH